MGSSRDQTISGLFPSGRSLEVFGRRKLDRTNKVGASSDVF